MLQCAVHGPCAAQQEVDLRNALRLHCSIEGHLGYHSFGIVVGGGEVGFAQRVALLVGQAPGQVVACGDDLLGIGHPVQEGGFGILQVVHAHAQHVGAGRIECLPQQGLHLSALVGIPLGIFEKRCRYWVCRPHLIKHLCATLEGTQNAHVLVVYRRRGSLFGLFYRRGRI